MSNDYYIYTGALRVFNDFNYKTDQYTFSYDYNASGYEKLISKYKINHECYIVCRFHPMISTHMLYL